MFAELLERVRAWTSGERALENVRAIASHHRIQSTPGYDRAAEWLVGALREAGLSPEVEPIRADGRTRHFGALLQQGWDCERAAAWLVGPAGREPLCDYRAEALSIVQRSAAMSGRYPLIAVGEGAEPGDYEGRDVRGRVVLASGPVHRVHALATARGAAGLLTDFRRQLPPVRTAADDLDAIAYTSFWWSERMPRGWGFVVSPRTGSRLRERLGAGERLELEGEIVARAFDTEVPLVTAALKAQKAGAKEVLVLAHLCHPRPGANDNASGAAAALECARTLALLWKRGAWGPHERTVRFLWMPEWNGTLAWLAADPGRAGRTVAAVNLDMVGEDQAQCGSTLHLEHPPHYLATFAEALLEDIRRAWIAGSARPAPRTADAAFSGGSDHAVLLDPVFGVPCPMLIQWPDRYYHSSEDTPDRCDPASLALAAGATATYAGALAAAGRAEIAALTILVERDAIRRVTEASIEADAPRRVARALARGRQALVSLGALGVTPRELRIPTSNLLRVEAAAGGWHGREEGGRIPVRRLRAPLDLLFHLLPGWDDLTAGEREDWRTLEQRMPGGRLTLELAWYACDGLRTTGAIAGVIELESGVRPPAAGAGVSLEAFFEATARLGLSRWKEAPPS